MDCLLLSHLWRSLLRSRDWRYRPQSSLWSIVAHCAGVAGAQPPVVIIMHPAQPPAGDTNNTQDLFVFIVLNQTNIQRPPIQRQVSADNHHLMSFSMEVLETDWRGLIRCFKMIIIIMARTMTSPVNIMKEPGKVVRLWS